MTPYWSSLADFLSMHGHGLYVWGAFGMCALLVAGESWSLARARRAIERARSAQRSTSPEERS